MAAEARREARRKRILENSGQRLQRIIDSQNLPSKPNNESTLHPSVEFQAKELSKNSKNSSEKSFKLSDDQVETNFTSTEPQRTFGKETRNFPLQSDEYIHSSSKERTSTTAEAEESKNGRWIRFGLNIFLAVFLVLLSQREDNGFLKYFLGPWIGLQIFMFSVSCLKQEVSSSWMSVFKVVLQLSGIPAHYTSTLNNVYTFFILLLFDLPIFVFTTVMTAQILTILTD